MADSTANLRRKLDSAADLQSVVRAMKAQAAASVGQYATSVAALGDYARTVELGFWGLLSARPAHGSGQAKSASGGKPADPRRGLRIGPGSGRPIQ